jgi:hypothetical protein
MYLPRIYDWRASRYRVRYAIRNILRDRVVNEGAFSACFEMEDAEEVIRTILGRGLKNPKLRIALERSHLINLPNWLAFRPEFSEAYHNSDGNSQLSIVEQRFADSRCRNSLRLRQGQKP